MWSIQKVVTKSISRNVVDLMISLLFDFLVFPLFIYIYVCVCKKKRFKEDETSSLFLREWFKTEATSVVWRHERARMYCAVMKQVWREIWRRVATEKDFVFRLFRVCEIWKKEGKVDSGTCVFTHERGNRTTATHLLNKIRMRRNWNQKSIWEQWCKGLVAVVVLRSRTITKSSKIFRFRFSNWILFFKLNQFNLSLLRFWV